MNRSRALSLLTLLIVAPSMMRAQSGLRAGASGRATTEVVLSAPRPASTTPMAGMAGMSPAAAASPTASPTAAAPAAAPVPAASAERIVIRLDYGQPHLRGRALHTDSLVPYDKSWRTGANTSTILTTDVDLDLGGTRLAKGAYVVYTIPGRTAWVLALQRSAGQTPTLYKDSDDVARITLRHTTLASPLESFTMWLIPSTAPGPARGELRFAWGTDLLTTTWAVR